ncbi:N-acetyltransferase [Desulfurivibrio dismutans]|uniref:N-acetyltransferase n=1 Tax=Desulfurivibrio dismutans TaxID=1398908 RepID=UPI0023DAD46D|nr:N-acetyltransferase [Desulfurivibrio alkaliphilus]MDF1615150.1 N-acetyltransferase [Desulfurivibrio alkaliphilus]
MTASQAKAPGRPAPAFLVRSARMDDVRAIYALLQFFAGRNLLLGRSLSSLYDHLRDFKVAVAADNDQQVLGVCSLHICWENLAEIRSLAVAESFQQAGVGRALVQTCLEEARNYGITRVFTLTYQPEFFKKIKFRPIDKNELPHKVWSDCINCPMFPDCNEESLIWEAEA